MHDLLGAAILSPSPDGFSKPCAMLPVTPSKSGYTRCTVDGVRDYAHRHSFRIYVGPIPDGYEIDHLCRTTRCIEPSHLDAVTGAENKRRSLSPSGLRFRQIACIHGHPFTESNTYIAPDSGTRKCRECRRATKRAAYARSIA